MLGFKAPLIVALPAPFYLLLGRHWHAAFLVNIVSMWVLFAALYRIARRWWSARAAVFALPIAGTMPLLYGLARWFMVEYALAAFVAAAICVLVESDGLKRDGHTGALRRLVRLRPAVEGQLPAVRPACVGLCLLHFGAPDAAPAMDCAALPVAGFPLVRRTSAADAGECARRRLWGSRGNPGNGPDSFDTHRREVPFARGGDQAARITTSYLRCWRAWLWRFDAKERKLRGQARQQRK